MSVWNRLEFEILSPTETNDGGIVEKTYSVAMTIEGTMRPLSGNEIITNEKLGYKSTHRFYSDIYSIETNQLIRNVGNQKVFEIRNIKNPMEMDHHLEVDCEYNPDLQSITES